MSIGTVQVGPCNCGGYGIVYDAKWESYYGRCHDTTETLRCARPAPVGRDDHGPCIRREDHDGACYHAML